MDFIRKKNENKPVIAFCYDFDHTLSPDDMQAQGYIQDLGYEVNDFWHKATELSLKNDMETNLAYMFLMAQEAKIHFPLTKAVLMEYGKKVGLFKGVKEWFGRINAYCLSKGYKAEHYILSSGLKEMIEGTEIASEFEKIYASSFMYDEAGRACWPAQAINYTNKTQFLFRISKGCTEVNDPMVNDYVGSDLYIPFKRMFYFGDSCTDIPCMRLLRHYEGYSFGIYEENKTSSSMEKLLKDGRIGYFAPVDYSEGKELDRKVKECIDEIVARERDSD